MDTNLRTPLVISIVIHILILSFLPAFKKKKIFYVALPIELVSLPPMRVEEKIIEEKKSKEVIHVKKVVKKEKKKPKPVKKKEKKIVTKQTKLSSTAKPLSLETAKFPYTYYLQQMRRKIDRNWGYKGTTGNLRAVIYFRIKSNGEITRTKISESSGNRIFDEMCSRAIMLSSPFAPLPAGYREEYLGIYFEFRYYEYK